MEALLKLKALQLLLEPKECCCSSASAALWYSLSVPDLVWVSHRCDLHPLGIPLAPSKDDVLVVRSINVSDDAVLLHANNTVGTTFFKEQSIFA